MHKTLKNTLLYVIGILLVALILQILSFAKGNEVFFPNIIDILKSFFVTLGEGKTYLYISTTLLELLIALILSFILGMALGILGGISNNAYKILKPLMSILRTLPIIVLIVILMLLTRLNFAPVLASVLVLTPIVYEGTCQGIKNIDKTMIDAYKLETNINFEVIRKVYIPLISSYSKASFISCLGMGIKILITCEYICGMNNTIGRAIILASQNLEYEKLYAYSFILVILIMLIEFLPKLIEVIVLKLKNNNDKLEMSYSKE